MPLSQAQLNALKTASNTAVTKMNAAVTAFTSFATAAGVSADNSTNVKNLINQLFADGTVPPPPPPPPPGTETDVLGQPLGSGPRNFGAVM